VRTDDVVGRRARSTAAYFETASAIASRELAEALRDQVMAAVRTDYAVAGRWAFTGMALVMAVLLVLVAFYPRDRRQTA
jgi:hypothetical protein